MRSNDDCFRAFTGNGCDDRTLSVDMLEDRNGDWRVRCQVTTGLSQQPLSRQVPGPGFVVAIVETSEHLQVSLHICAVQLRTEILHSPALRQVGRKYDWNTIRKHFRRVWPLRDVNKVDPLLGACEHNLEPILVAHRRHTAFKANFSASVTRRDSPGAVSIMKDAVSASNDGCGRAVTTATYRTVWRKCILDFKN
jgi:hypothetical protein